MNYFIDKNLMEETDRISKVSISKEDSITLTIREKINSLSTVIIRIIFPVILISFLWKIDITNPRKLSNGY